MKRLMIIVGAGVIVTLLALALVGSVAARRGGVMDMGGQATGSGMLGPGLQATSVGTPVSLTQVRTRAEQYLSDNQYSGLKVGEVMQFSNQFYAEVLNTQTGQGAFELLIGLDGQGVHPEPQSMMWNTDYSLIAGVPGIGLQQMMNAGTGPSNMMGAGAMASDHSATTMPYAHEMFGSDHGSMMNGVGISGIGSGSMMGYHSETALQLTAPLSTDAALQRAQTWLDQNRSGVTASNPTQFPGYVTVDLEQGGKIVGMLSVQSATGTIWEHVWHGNYIATDTGS